MEWSSFPPESSGPIRSCSKISVSLGDGVSVDPARYELFFALVAGCIIGGIVYVLLDTAVNSKGGFLRRPSTVLRHYRKRSAADRKKILERIAAIPLFTGFPAEHAETLMSVMQPVTFKDGDIVVEEGEPADATYVIVDGSMAAWANGRKIGTADAGDMVANLIPMFMDTPNLATGKAVGDLRCLRIDRAGFQQLRELSPEFDAACRKMVEQRLESLGEKVTTASRRASSSAPACSAS